MLAAFGRFRTTLKTISDVETAELPRSSSSAEPLAQPIPVADACSNHKRRAAVPEVCRRSVRSSVGGAAYQEFVAAAGHLLVCVTRLMPPALVARRVVRSLDGGVTVPNASEFGFSGTVTLLQVRLRSTD